MHVVVLGAGYVGLVTGVNLARDGAHHVTLVESSPSRFAELRRGVMPFEEPGLAAAFAEAQHRIDVVESFDQAELADLVFVAVATPISDSGEPDLRQLLSVTNELKSWPDLHICIRSTLPPGTSNRLPRMLGRATGERLSTNPEFLRQGSAMNDFSRPSRIVFGRYPETSEEHLALVELAYAWIDAPRLRVDVAAAELIKNVANGFLALKLSFVNEVAALSEEYGVEVDEVLEGIALDPRIGSAYMRPGLGFGGSCLPKELQVLASAGRHRGIGMHVARAAAQVNIEQQDRFIRRVLAELPTNSSQVGLLGLSFKAHTDDLRGSPAIYVARRLIDDGHTVVAFDPAVRSERALDAVPRLVIAKSAADVFADADAVVVATDWPEFAELPLADLRGRTRNPVLFDGRGLIDPGVATGAGFHYRAVGRHSRAPSVVALA